MRKMFQRMAAMALAVTLLVTCVPADIVGAKSAANFKKGDELVVTTPGGVYLHTKPDRDSRRITALGYGNHLQVLNVNYNTGWMWVSCGANKGYVLGENGFFDDYEVTPPTYTYTNKQAKVAASALNVHSTPIRRNDNLVGLLYQGWVVEALGYTTTGWTKVKYYDTTGTHEGWVDSAWLKISNVKPQYDNQLPTVQNFDTVSGWSAQVNTSGDPLNMHVSPSISAKVIDTLDPGQVVTILAESEDWYKVTLNVDGEMETGYVWKSYTKKIDALDNIKLNVLSKTLKRKGAKSKYQLLVRGTTGMNYKVSWKSSNKKVATVTKKGVVKAKKKGTAKITCTIRVEGRAAIKRTCRIKVR